METLKSLHHTLKDLAADESMIQNKLQEMDFKKEEEEKSGKIALNTITEE